MPNGIYLHCFARRLNLVINNTCKIVSYMSDYFSILSQIHSFFTESGVANRYFRQAQQQLGLDRSSSLKLWANAHWDSRWKSIDAIIFNFSAIVQALENISEEDGATLDYVRGENFILSIIHQIKDLRNEQSFNEIYDAAKGFCELNGTDFIQQYRLHRATTIPARFEEFLITSTLGQRDIISTSTHYINRIYFSLIDCMLVELNDRVSSKPLSLMKSISTIYPDSENFLNIDDIDAFSEHIGGNLTVLKNEFAVIKSMLESKTVKDVFEF
ncbi:unnamed protein product [Rotaria sordida]|uniref:Uncharacterized protein n=1 Tax=Rotaria sordida TaxID=392033 RepID=A0A815JZG8_9BILA|nr:unnamed protein product [Rotaria sordida]CAF4096999.1 unnamed protein product [Rotaria sordida]